MKEEFAEVRAPSVGGMGVAMLGPTLIVHGYDEQKKEHLGLILAHLWLKKWRRGLERHELVSNMTQLE